MKLSAKILACCYGFLVVASFAISHFGIEHEIKKIPPERRAAMSDFDWIGIEWIMLSLAVMAVAIILAVTAFVLWLLQRRRAKRAGKAS